MRKFALLMPTLIAVLFLVAPAQAEDIIQTQPSSDGNMEAYLIGVKARKDVLTVKVALKNIKKDKIVPVFLYKDVYYVDIDNEKKYFGLKDSEGKYIAGPIYDNDNGGRFWFDILPDERKIVWIKFPAPTDTIKSIDIFIPGILPFEDIKL